MKSLPTKVLVARRVRQMLEIKNLKRAQAARLCDMPLVSMESYVQGTTMPGGENIAKLALGLRCSADWLLSGEDE